MNIKHIILWCVVVQSINCIAQDNKICGEINYKHTIKISSVFRENFLMKFDKDNSFSEEIDIISSEDSEDLKSSDKGTSRITVIGRENLNPKFFYNNKDEFYFRDIFSNKTLLVKEDKIEWNWNLHSETKKIGKFTCQKATIKFRGRHYSAWFTNEIPVSFGPWKFRGLSGLILEVYDVDKVFHIIATEVKIKNTDCTINVNKEDFKNAMTVAKYQIKKDELIEEMFKKLSSKMPKGSKVLKWDKNCEDCPKDIEIFDEN